MKKFFNDHDQETIIIFCHGNWGEQIIEDMQDNFGISKNYLIYSLTNDLAVSDYKTKIKEDINRLDHLPSLFLTDLMEGSTSTCALKISLEFDQIPVVTGLNLPLLLEIDRLNHFELSNLNPLLEKVSQKTNCELLKTYGLNN